jgi:hypothetical protein
MKEESSRSPTEEPQISRYAVLHVPTQPEQFLANTFWRERKYNKTLFSYIKFKKKIGIKLSPNGHD